MATDVNFMHRALELASRARGATSPNPMVGCVVVRDGDVVGEGFHARAGEAHAEVVAVHAAGGRIEGATVYVSLEPCAHQGRTPPCTEFLLRSRPARVVVAMEDPNPKVSGKGIAALRAAGIAVDVGVLEQEALRLNEAYAVYITEQRPFTIAKCAMTLDGKIATRTGSSKWITGEAARAHVHALRGQVDAVLVGRRTLELDDPSLTARGASPVKQPVRIVVTSGGEVDAGKKVFSSEGGATWVVGVEDLRSEVVARSGDRPQQDPRSEVVARSGERPQQDLRSEVVALSGTGTRDRPQREMIRIPGDGSGRVDMRALMMALGRREIMSLLIEGGGETLAAAFSAGVVDKVMWYVAPKIVGGRDAVTPVEGEGVATVDEAIALERMQATALGDDVLIEAYVKRGEHG